jgi:hypothetical protein
VYTNPACKTTEFLYRELVLGSFFQRNKLEPHDLLSWNDHQLHTAIEREVDFKKVEHLNQGDAAWPTISYFDSWENAREAEQEAAKSGHLTLLASLAADQKPNAKTKRHLVKAADGSLKPFNKACPEVSERLEVLARTPICPPTQLIVYPFKKSALSKPMIKAWQAARERWKTEPAIYPK